MRYNFCYIFLIFLLNYTIYAQYQTAHWYFGLQAGLDFSSGSPVAVTNGILISSEGVSSISDENANLLFYTNGQTIYTRNHTLMTNGENLYGQPSSTQNAIIVPAPGVNDLFYIFTTDAVEATPKRGLNYTLVDMSLGVDGEVVSSQKNISIPLSGVQQVSEKITAAAKSDCSGYWILTYYGNKIYAFSVTENGLDIGNPTISNVELPNDNDLQVAMKISPDGKKLACTYKGGTGALALYDFDASSGAVYNEIVLSDYPQGPFGNLYYSVEFSPDSQVLYATHSGLVQYDLNASSIAESQVVLYQTLFGVSGALQIGLDEKIYYARLNSSIYLGVINDPNNLTAPDFNPFGVFLAGREHSYGLANFPQPFYHTNLYINGLQEPGEFCRDNPVDFSYCFSGGVLPEWTVYWDFGDGNTSTEENPLHTYDLPGNYTVTLEITIGLNVMTKQQDMVIKPSPQTHSVSTTICQNEGDFVTIDLSEFYEDINTSDEQLTITFHRTLENAENNESALLENFETNASVVLYVRSENAEGCISISTLEIIFQPIPDFEIEEPDELCYDESTVLRIRSGSEYTIYWYDAFSDEAPIHIGNDFVTPNLTENQSYWVEVVSADGCSSERKEIAVKIHPLSELYIEESVVVVCRGESALLKANTNDNNLIRWFENVDATQWIATGETFATPDITETKSYWVEAHHPYIYCVSERKEIVVDLCLTIPKGISPNGDGFNDSLDLSKHQIISLKIFNRYGTEVYNYGMGYTNEWSGQDSSGNLLPEGTYFYRIISLSKEYTGYIYVSREVR